MKISIVIPTYNAQGCLVKLLNKLQQQTISNYELIIIDSSSSDETVNIARKYTDNIVIIPSSKFDHGGTRAKAAEVAQGEILIYFTQDALPVNNFTIENMIKVFDNKNVAAAYGRQLSYPDTNLFGKHLRLFNYPDCNVEYRTKNDIGKYGIKTAQLSNSFCAYRKDLLLKCDNFKKNLILGEDVYIGAKFILNDYILAYVGNSQVFHSHNYTIKEEFKRYFDIGVFHKCEPWILEYLGKPDGEGFKYIKSELNFLLSNKKYYLIFSWFFRNLAKYIGYKLGVSYSMLPASWIPYLSMHSRWWK